MSFTIPSLRNITNGSTGYDIQAVADPTDFAALAAGLNGYFVVSGCAVTISGGKIHVAAGTLFVNGVLVSVSAQTFTPVAVTAKDRRDIVTVASTGTASVTKGTEGTVATQTRSTPAATGLPPEKPTIPTGHVLLAEVTRPHGATVATICIVDKRVVRAMVVGQSFISANVTLASGTAKNVTSYALSPGTYVVNGQALCTVDTADDIVNIALTTTTASMSTALGSAQVEGAAAETTVTHAGSCDFVCVVSVTSTTTVYLNAEANATAKVLAAAKYATTDVASGLVVYKIL